MTRTGIYVTPRDPQVRVILPNRADQCNQEALDADWLPVIGEDRSKPAKADARLLDAIGRAFDQAYARLTTREAVLAPSPMREQATVFTYDSDICHPRCKEAKRPKPSLVQTKAFVCRTPPDVATVRSTVVFASVGLWDRLRHQALPREDARAGHPLLPANIVSIMERSGRHKIAPHSSGEPGPLDPGWEPIIPFELEQQARAEPQQIVEALAEVIVPVGGWAVYGAAELALDVMNHDLSNSAYRALFVGGLEVRRKADVPWVMLNSFDQMYWDEAHPDEPWQPERTPPTREVAKITPVEVYQERRVAQVTPSEDSKLMFITRPAPDRYLMVLETPQDDGSRLRGEIYAASSLYDAYSGMGERVIAHFWNDPEFEPFCKYVAPKI